MQPIRSLLFFRPLVGVEQLRHLSSGSIQTDSIAAILQSAQTRSEAAGHPEEHAHAQARNGLDRKGLDSDDNDDDDGVGGGDL